MDVVFLSRMIGELILDHDSLSLPGLGTFMAEDMPASFSDRGYTINPPYRRLSFSERDTSDGLLAQLYAAGNGLSSEEAASIISSFLMELKEMLQQDKTLELPGLGRLRATRENHLFFVPDEELDIYPDAFGLDPVSLKSHSVSALPDIPVPSRHDNPASPAVPETTVTPETTANLASPAVTEPPVTPGTPAAPESPAVPLTPVKPRRRALRWALGAAGFAAVLLLAFVLVSRLAPGSTDPLLYTQEELAIINCPEDGSGLPR